MPDSVIYALQKGNSVYFSYLLILFQRSRLKIWSSVLTDDFAILNVLDKTGMIGEFKTGRLNIAKH
jgi:hypothetical protein